MDKKELGGIIKGKMHEAADAVKNTVKEVKIPDIKKADIKMPEINVPDQVKNVFKKSGDTNELQESDEVVAEGMDEKTREQKQLEQKETEFSRDDIKAVRVLSPINAVKIFYYLMAADGKIEETEEVKFEQIGKEIDPEFDEHKEYVVRTCKEQLDKVIDSEDYFDVVQDGVEEAILSRQMLDKGYVPAKLLVWDLLTIAYSDDSYNDQERKLMKYIVRKIDIPKDVFLEMESSYLTVKDLEKELEWIKTTDRPYLTIETHVKEIERREQAIYESIKALICL